MLSYTSSTMRRELAEQAVERRRCRAPPGARRRARTRRRGRRSRSASGACRGSCAAGARERPRASRSGRRITNACRVTVKLADRDQHRDRSAGAARDADAPLALAAPLGVDVERLDDGREALGRGGHRPMLPGRPQYDPPVRVVLQRVSWATVDVDGERIASIGPGLLALVGVAVGDGPQATRSGWATRRRACASWPAPSAPSTSRWATSRERLSCASASSRCSPTCDAETGPPGSEPPRQRSPHRWSRPTPRPLRRTESRSPAAASERRWRWAGERRSGNDRPRQLAHKPKGRGHPSKREKVHTTARRGGQPLKARGRSTPRPSVAANPSKREKVHTTAKRGGQPLKARGRATSKSVGMLV